MITFTKSLAWIFFHDIVNSNIAHNQRFVQKKTVLRISLLYAYVAQEHPGCTTFVTNCKSKYSMHGRKKKHTDLQSVSPT